MPVCGRAVPFVVGGGSFQRKELLRATQVGPAETAKGYVFGTGVEAKFSLIRIIPEVRYTRWTGDFSFRDFRFREASLVHRNQFEFLVGIGF